MYFKNTIILLMIIISSISHAQVKSLKQIVTEAKSKIFQISIDELKTKIDSEEKFHLIDIRTEKEYLAGHIQNAVWISRGKLEFVIQTITTDPNAVIILHCRSGGRSSLAVNALLNIGYENVMNLDGGFKKWVEAGNNFYNMHGEIRILSFEKNEKG